jgi:hypothetical protein
MAILAVFSAWHFYDGWLNPVYKAADKAGDMWYNRAVAIALAAGFIGFVIAFFFMLKSQVVVDEQGININGKRRIDWKSILRVDDSKVEKGLLGIYYQEGSKEARYVLDDYKIDHFEEMLDEISIHRPDLLTPMDESVDEPLKK